ncbi:MAG: phosphatase PAP2 family protein [Kofleriaceae bacterium]
MELPWSERRAAPRGLLVVVVVTAVISALCILAVDQPVALALAPYEPSSLWDRGIDLVEWVIVFPVWRYALPVALVVGMLACVIVKRWRGAAPAWMFVAGVHLASRLTVNWFKDGTARLRPWQWVKKGATGETFGWEGGVSFPSGHVVLFGSVIIPLVVLFPKLRPLLAVLAFVALARIAVEAHFVSDTIAAVTLIAAWTWLVGLAARPLKS